MPNLMTDAPVPAIAVRDLKKAYGPVQAVAGISFTVARGEVFALLGPNGAGKTTTVETLEGYRRPDTGTVEVLGMDPVREGTRLKDRIGVMPQSGGIYLTMTPREALKLFRTFYSNPRDPEELIALVGLEEAASTPYRRLSGGQKQRLGLALALLPSPEVVFLDEPTAGLDPQARQQTWEIVRGLRAEGVAVLLTTHYLEEAERLADRAAIIDHGRLVASGRPGELVASDASTVFLRARDDFPQGVLLGLPHVRRVDHEGPGQYVLGTRSAPDALAEVAAAARDAGIAILELRVGSRSLEDVFLQLTAGEREP